MKSHQIKTWENQQLSTSTAQAANAAPMNTVQNDNRPEALQMKSFQKLLNDSEQARQLKQVKKSLTTNNPSFSIIQKKANHTGLPDHLKTGIENLSVHTVDDVKVHYKEANVMGTKAVKRPAIPLPNAPSAMVFQNKVVQRSRTIDTILNFINQNKAQLGEIGGAHMKRLMYWNDHDFFDTDKGGILNLKTVKKAMDQKTPDENESADEDKLAEFMKVRTDFSVRLPVYFGGGKLWFRKNLSSVIFEGRGWISDNIYWRSESGAKYMIHAILEWSGSKAAEDKPKAHITLRNAETQIKIDLDVSNPLPKKKKRIEGTLEVTRASYSQGLDVDREPGINMANDEGSFANLKAKTTQDWLADLELAAQKALFPELQEVD